jgi:hypothetical protein
LNLNTLTIHNNECKSWSFLGCVIFSSLTTFSPSQIQISASESFSQMPPGHAFPLQWETKFHTCIKEQLIYTGL